LLELKVERDGSVLLTKHEQIIKHIENLEPGSKISVRGIAKEIGVSEGTAYRAIKEAENIGYVSTIERVGTVRIEKKQRNRVESLTFAEVVKIVDGHVLGGREGLHKTLNKFVIGAMKMEAMMKYVEPGSLLIVGNRTQVHKISLERGAAVLITGGFDTDPDVKRLADEKQLPVISCKDDTFTVATKINRAIYDYRIKKEIMFVEDMIDTEKPVYALRPNQRIKDWRRMVEETKHGRFPVIDEQDRVVGVVTTKDTFRASPETLIEKVMTRNPVTVSLNTSVASAAHMMVWEGIELLPVVDTSRRLIGVISRKDVIEALQNESTGEQIENTYQEMVLSQFQEERTADGGLLISGKITPRMANQLGVLSGGVLATLITEGAYRLLRLHNRGDLIVENLTIYFIKPVQMESRIAVKPGLIEVSRRFGKIDVEVFNEDKIVGKALLTVQVIDRR
jgi:predicted transcriptional regulator